MNKSHVAIIQHPWISSNTSPFERRPSGFVKGIVLCPHYSYIDITKKIWLSLITNWNLGGTQSDSRQDKDKRKNVGAGPHENTSSVCLWLLQHIHHAPVSLGTTQLLTASGLLYDCPSHQYPCLLIRSGPGHSWCFLFCCVGCFVLFCFSVCSPKHKDSAGAFLRPWGTLLMVFFCFCFVLFWSSEGFN